MAFAEARRNVRHLLPAARSAVSGPASQAFGKPVARLGLASRRRTAIAPEDVLFAIDRGVRFLNWPALAEGPAGAADAMSAAIGALGPRREEVVVCIQFGARTAAPARAELAAALRELGTDYVDVVTLYYVETAEEWREIAAPGGALEVLRAAKRAGAVRRIGITSHARRLAAEIAGAGLVDALMIRYNAAHRGAEADVFPVARERGVAVIAYTALRWGALLEPTPDDPPGFAPPPAPAWYRFVLERPEVSVVLCAPENRAELEADLEVLAAPGPLAPEDLERLRAHGDRVRRHAGRFA
jgi:aryl-alcohol dehydrogenase-like predicted oxidoreductase